MQGGPAATWEQRGTSPGILCIPRTPRSSSQTTPPCPERLPSHATAGLAHDRALPSQLCFQTEIVTPLSGSHPLQPQVWHTAEPCPQTVVHWLRSHACTICALPARLCWRCPGCAVVLRRCMVAASVHGSDPCHAVRRLSSAACEICGTAASFWDAACLSLGSVTSWSRLAWSLPSCTCTCWLISCNHCGWQLHANRLSTAILVSRVV